MRPTTRLAAVTVSLLIALAGLAQQHPNQEKGFDPTKIYHYGDIDSINTFNGNLVVTLPVTAVFRASPAISYGFSAVYNSNVWDGQDWTDYFLTTPCERCNAGIGWTLSLGRLVQSTDPVKGTIRNGAFLYESPDGRDHAFSRETNRTIVPDPDQPYDDYTKDESCLFIHVERFVAKLYFPDGTTRTFAKVGEGTSDEHWDLVRIDDRFENSVVIIIFRADEPNRPAGWKRETWLVKEYKAHDADLVRTTTLEFLISPEESSNEDIGTSLRQTTVQSIKTQGFRDRAPSTYTFNYTPAWLSRNETDTWGSYRNLGTKQGPPNKVRLLESIGLPAGEKYKMTYNTCADHCTETGQLMSVTLPTGARHEWSYAREEFPGMPHKAFEDNEHVITPQEEYRIHSVSVAERRLYDIGGTTPAGVWRYDHVAGVEEECAIDSVSWYVSPVIVGTVTTPDNTTTATYYSTVLRNDQSNCLISGEGWDPLEYGLPISHWGEDPSGHLSTEVYASATPPGTFGKPSKTAWHITGAGLRKRTTRGTYGLETVGSAAVPQEISSHTVFHDDCDNNPDPGPCDPATKESGTHYVDTYRSGPDGYGHFRQISTGGNFGDGPVYRTTFTNYRGALPDSGWMFDTYSEQCARMDTSRRDNAATDCQTLVLTAPRGEASWKKYCFESNGFMSRRRVISDGRGSRPLQSGNGDLLAVFEKTPSGEVDTESYYGGETPAGGQAQLNAETDTQSLCAIGLPSQAVYSIHHTYYAGSLESSQYIGLPFKSVDRTVDKNTGLIWKDRDASGRETVFDYDSAGRLTSQTTAGFEPVTYDYVPAALDTNWIRAKATSTQTGTAEGTKKATFIFDGFGRVIRELSNTEQDDGKLRGHDTIFDAFGRKDHETVTDRYDTETSTAPANAMRFVYDFNGRPTTITPPDSTTDQPTETRYVYYGARETDRTVHVATLADPKANATTKQYLDPLGRLVAVTEPEASGPTTYKYDVDDHLIHVAMPGEGVTQERTFDYDSRGFLLSEQHPEFGRVGKGTVQYSAYDARGHAGRKITGGSADFDLTFEYDRAERLTKVRKTAAESSSFLKRFTYGDAVPSPEPGSFGKLVEAERANSVRIGAAQAVTPVVVDEKYHYDDTTGFLANKQTVVSIDGQEVQTFGQDYLFDHFGSLKSAGYPSLTTGGITPPARTLTNLNHNGFLTGVAGYARINYLGNGMVGDVAHITASGNDTQVDRQEADASGMARPAKITFSGYCVGPPVSALEPADTTIVSGHTAQLSVTAPAGIATPTYAWYRVIAGIASPVAGGNQRQLTTPELAATSYFYVLVGDGTCATQSRTAKVTVRTCDTIDITTQPANRDGMVGSNVTFTVTASETDAHYQWYEGNSGDTTKPVGTDAATLTVGITGEKSYWVRVFSNDRLCSIDSTTALLTICTGAAITVQPVDAAIKWQNASTSLTARVEVSGRAPFDYTWKIDGVATAQTTHNGVTLPYDEMPVTFDQAGTHTVTVDVHGTCGATVTSNQAKLTAYGAECDWSILGLSADMIEIPRAGMSSEVSVSTNPADDGHYTYEWFNSKGVHVGGNTRSIFLSAYPFESYYVKVTHECVVNGAPVTTSSKVSSKVYLWIGNSCPIAPVTISPITVSIAAGGTAHFQAVTDWPIGIHFQWYHGQSGDTRDPIASTPGHPDQLDVDYHVTSYWVRITNDCGLHLDSAAATVQIDTPFVCHPVVITRSPQSAEIASGQSVTLTCDATGSPEPHSFTWYEGLDDLHSLGATYGGVKLVSPAETTTYWVQAGNGCASTKSEYATLHVVSCGSNQVTTQPADSETTNMAPVTLTVAVSDPSQIASYQWYEGASGDTAHPAGSTTTTFTTPLLDASTSYWVRMTTTSGCKFDSHAALVDVCIAPTLSHSQTNYNLQRGNGVWINVVAHGTSLEYQWYLGTTLIPNATFPNFYVTATETASYFCRVTNRCGSADSDTITVSVCPIIDAQPVAANALVMSGTTTTLTATAGGTLQWYQGEQGGTSHPFGGNSATVTTPPITADTTFWLRAVSGGCSVDSNPVQVHLCTQPFISWGNTAQNLRPGDSVTLTVVVTPESNDVWFYEGQPGDTSHPVTNGQTYVTVTPSQTTTYWARAKLGNCWADTGAFTVNVCVPKITQQPSGSMLINQATPVTLSVTAQLATSHQWYAGTRGDTTNPVAGATAASVNVAPVADTHYWVRVQGSCAYVDSDEVIVTVCHPPDGLNFLGQGAITRGQTWSYSVAAATGTNLTYQWYQGTAPDTSTPIANATSAIITVAPQNTTNYWARVSSPCGTKDSNTGSVHVCVTPSIDAQPQDVTIFAGATATLSVTASEASTEPLHYNWYRIVSGQAPVAVGTDSNTFTTPALSATTQYQVTVSAQGCAIDSNVVTVSMCAYPSTVNAPNNQQTRVGQQVAVTGVPNDGSNLYFFYQGAAGDVSHPLSTVWTAQNYVNVSPVVTTSYWYQLKNGSCTSGSGTGTVNVCIPTITSQPASVMINSGQSASFSVTADTAGLTYQWYLGTSGQSGNPIAGATSSTYTTPALTSGASYWVLVTGSCGQVAGSNTATVTICQPPQITSTLQGAQWIARGSSGTVWVSASGTNLTYQWYSGTPGNTTAPVAGATTASVSVSPQNTTNYWCRVSGTCGSTDSVAITVNVCASPAITAQPQSVAIFSGQSTTLSVTATEATTSPMQYQWYQGTSGTTTTPIGGATSANYTTPALGANTNYWVRVSCGICNPADSATATVSICPYPAAVSGPADVNIAIGQTTRLTTIPQSGSNSYRWYRGASLDTSNPITSWQANNYVDVNPTTTTQYWAQISTGTCVTRTLTTTVNVCIPTITTQPANIMINPGASTTLTVAANTTGLTYQWYLGTAGTTTSPISGATAASVNVSPSTTTNYWVKVTGSCSQSVNSNTATVSVCVVPSISTHTPSAAIARGTAATLSVTATGTNLTYQWYTGAAGNTSAPISGATAASVSVSPFDNTNYWCRVSGTCGTRDTATIMVSVCTNPAITTQPQSVTIFAGGSTTLSVAASEGASSPMTYQWYTGASGNTASPIGGATSTSYTTPALSSTTNYWVRVSCGVCSPADSATATVSMCTYAQSVSGPGDAQVTVGQAVRLFGVPASTGNAYRWYTGASGNTSTPVSGWSSSNFLDVNPAVTTSYWYQLSNGTCTSNSTTGTLSVCVPTFTQQPQGTTVPSGTPVTLTAIANTAGVTYQWYVGASGNTSSPISGATGTSINVAPTSTTSYWVRAWSTCNRGTDSATATVTICTSPVISRQPYNAAPINPGYAGTTDVIAIGGTSYQWYRGESGDTSSPISGATSSSVTVSTFSSLRVWVRVTNACGSVNSNAAWISVYPSISSNLQGGTKLNAGSTVRLTVGATGTSLHYTWRLNGNSVATDSPTAIIQIDSDNSGVTCDVSSGIATTHSDTAYFTLCGGLYVIGIQVYPANNGCKSLFVTTNDDRWVSSIDWYKGPRGDTSQPVTMPVCPTSSTTYWARVNSWDDPNQQSCYTDSHTVTVP